MRHLSIVFVACAFISGVAFAGSTNCSDVSGDLHYQTFEQDGGPCCGHSTSSLVYQGKMVKQTEDREQAGGNPASHSDSNPGLSVAEIHSIDMGNSSVSGETAT